jgi:predicted nucleotidyltransferase
MKPSLVIQTHRDKIRDIALRHNVVNVRVFGSAIHGNDTDSSDLDILVDPTSQTSMFDIAKIQVELTNLLGINVDVLTPRALPDKFRNIVISEAIPL